MIEIEGRLAYRPMEAARALALGRTKLFQLLDEGAIKSVLVGRVRLIPVAELEAFLQRQMAAVPDQQAATTTAQAAPLEPMGRTSATHVPPQATDIA